MFSVLGDPLQPSNLQTLRIGSNTASFVSRVRWLLVCVKVETNEKHVVIVSWSSEGCQCGQALCWCLEEHGCQWIYRVRGWTGCSGISTVSLREVCMHVYCLYTGGKILRTHTYKSWTCCSSRNPGLMMRGKCFWSFANNVFKCFHLYTVFFSMRTLYNT